MSSNLVCSQAYKFAAAHGTHGGQAAIQPQDLATAVETTQKSLFLKSKCEELRLKTSKMGDSTDGFEGILYQVIEAPQTQKEFAEAKIQKVLFSFFFLIFLLNHSILASLGGFS